FMSEKVALITGCSSGFGLLAAVDFAKAGFRVVATMRNVAKQDRLLAAAKEAGVDVDVQPLDVTDAESILAAREYVEKEVGRLDVLVNNAGYGVPEDFLRSPWKTQDDFLRVMVTSVQHLTHTFVPAMRERGWGRVLNVASVAAYAPPRPGTLYGSTKRFMVEATRSLALELEGSGVTATALCPGFTYSEFHDVMGTRATVSKLPKWMWMDAEDVAREGLDAMMKGRVVHVSGRVNRVLVAGGRIAPLGLVRAVSRALGVARQRGA
ncbi:SDR family NAD(P)-dependent oxidoreductase, partial [bacterium]|nr:SDR family NAD(P)-dependent oxidoreductase [bacterium]